MGWENCVLLPAVGKWNSTFSSNFTQPRKSLLVQCYSLRERQFTWGLWYRSSRTKNACRKRETIEPATVVRGHSPPIRGSSHQRKDEQHYEWKLSVNPWTMDAPEEGCATCLAEANPTSSKGKISRSFWCDSLLHLSWHGLRKTQNYKYEEYDIS